jgi:hypothetical protein
MPLNHESSTQEKSMEEPRKRGFRLGQYHGKVLKPDDAREARIARDLYMAGSVSLEVARHVKPFVRLAGYEIPLGLGRRTRSVDLVGFDSAFRVYLIELKRADNAEPIEDIVEQVEGYAETFGRIRPFFQEEFSRAFFHHTALGEEVIRIICAPSAFFDRPGRGRREFIKQYDGDALFCTFARFAAGDDLRLLDRPSPVPLRVLNRETAKRLFGCATSQS